MTVHEALEAERTKLMKPLLPLTPEPAVSIPLKYILINRDRDVAHITLADLAKSFSD